uniref:Poly A polymerase head domain-containing protein n=1 Tax=Wuchereria bancrofti TaxID=6293 RepID=A0A1I8EXZ9_WUCBA
MRGNCLKYLLLQIRNISGKQLIVPKMVSEPIVPIVQKIDTPQFKALFTPELIKLNDLFKKNDFQLRMAGGAVRDLLMGIKPSDIDFATNATPEKMKELFLREGIRMLNKNGEEHGTITCRIDDKENFEITTLRHLDANRRDLTVNSLFLDLDGTVIDYFGGIKDLEKRQIVFVGDANQRIQEDYLRILRYFRFYGRLAIDGEMHDKATLDAIISNRNGLKDISGERIWMELKKICVGRLGGAVLTTMLKRCNLASLLGLPENADTVYFCKLHKRYYPKIEAMTLLSSLFTEMGQIEIFHKRCKLSYAEKTLTEFILEHRDEARKNVNSILFFKNILLVEERLHKFTRKKIQTSREKVIELAKYAMVDDELINELSIWEMPTFPIGGIDLMHNNISPGPHVKQILDHLFQIWIESEWMMSKEELLKHINDIEWNDKKTRVGCKRKLSSDTT